MSRWSHNRAAVKAGRGFAILTVVFVMMIFAILGIAAVSLITGSAQVMSDEYHSAQAFDVAGAGIEYIAMQLKADTDWSDNASVTKTFGPGSFTVDFIAKTTTTATVRSSGTVEGLTRVIQENMEAGDPAAFRHALYTSGSIGNSGGTGTVTGNSEAAGSIATGAMTFNGRIEANDSDVSVPTPNWAYWQSAATTTISGNYTFNSGTYSGIYYITGNVDFHGDGITVNGTIVTRGKFTINGNSNVRITATAPNPAVVANDTVKFNGGSNNNITGFVYTTADIKLSGNAALSVTGGFIAGTSGISFGPSNSTITYSSSYAPKSGFTGGESGGVEGSNWKEYY